MKTSQKRLAIIFLSVIMAFAVVLGFTANRPTAFAGGAPTVTMVSGAQVRYNVSDPGIKFTAKIENYNTDYAYGMLILPEDAFTTLKDENFIGNYHAYFAENQISESDYADKICYVYRDSSDGMYTMSLALTHIYDYTRSFVGVGYAVKDGEYTYAEVDLKNARSIVLVSQLALQNEPNLTEEKIDILTAFTNGNFVIDSSDYLTNNNLMNTGDTKEADYAFKYVFNVGGETVSQVTKKAYAGGSTVSFRYYIPEGTESKWWGVAYSTTKENLDIYAAADASKAHKNSVVLGAWVEEKFTLPEGGPYYLYFGSEVGHWLLNGSNAYALIDDFTIGNEKESFSAYFTNSIFEMRGAAACQIEKLSDPEFTFGESLIVENTGELAMKYIFNASGETVSQVTKKAYAGGSSVSFRYYIPEGTEYKWWGVAWSTTNSGLDIYAASDASKAHKNSIVLGVWVEEKFTLPEGGPYYLYFGSEVGHWKLNGEDAYALIDNFTVNGETETFSDGVQNSIFNVLVASGVEDSADGEGYVEETLDGEYAMKLYAKVNDGVIPTASVRAFPAGSTITFKYFISSNAKPTWWRTAYTTTIPDRGSYTDYYKASYISNGNKVGEWTTQTLTLPNDSDYYVFLVTAEGEWGEGAYVLIDDFTVTAPSGEVIVEDFNKGFYSSSLFEARTSGVAISEGYGYVEGGENPSDKPSVVDTNSLEYLLENGSIVDFLIGGGYASIKRLVPLSIFAENIPHDMLFIEGSFNYEITGEKQFAIYLGKENYIVIDQESIAFYCKTTKVSKFACDSKNKLLLYITADGKIIVALDGKFYTLGKANGEVTEVKLVALGGKGSVTFKDFNIISHSCLAVDVPRYETDDVIDFTAYAFDSTAMVTDAGYALLAEAGFTKSMALLQGRVGGLDYSNPSQSEVERLMAEVNADAIKALDLAQKYGLKHYVFNEPIYNLERQTAWYSWMDELAAAATYTTHPAYAGHFLADEPEKSSILNGYKDEIGEMKNAYAAYKSAFPSGDGYVNLLSRTATSLSNKNTYKTYIQTYLNNVALVENGSRFISYDMYPLTTSDIESNHLWNLEYIAGLCRDNGLEFRTYIKASTSGNGKLRATQSANDLYVQIYSALCYGVREIVYYQFTDHETVDGTAGDGVISGVSLEKTNVYDWTKQVNNEIHAFDSAYMSFNWKSASVFGKTSLTQFNNLDQKASAYGYISSVSSSASVLVGNFDDADGQYVYGAKHAYMVQNYGNTKGATSATSAVNITFNGTPTRALVYQGGKPTVITLNDNVLTLNLMIGEGAFVIPLI